MAKAHVVENYPGIVRISGTDLAEVMRKQVELHGVEVRFERVYDIKKVDREFLLKAERGEYRSKAVILATGAAARKLGVKGEEKLAGRGVSYCALCDGPLFKGKVVGVVGGSDSAVKDAIFLSSLAKKVYLIHRRDQLRAEAYLQDELFELPNVEVLWNKVVRTITGKERLEKVKLRDVKTSEDIELQLDGLFIEVGGIPTVALAKKLGVELDERGYVRVDKAQRTNVEGFFAAGDVTDFPLKQIATAVGQGATAAYAACTYLGLEATESRASSKQFLLRGISSGR